MAKFIKIKRLKDINFEAKTMIINTDKIIKIVFDDNKANIIFDEFGISVDKAEILEKLNLEDNVEKSLKELIKEINISNQILLSSHTGENLRNTPIDKANKISEHYKNLLNKLK